MLVEEAPSFVGFDYAALSVSVEQAGGDHPVDQRHREALARQLETPDGLIRPVLLGRAERIPRRDLSKYLDVLLLPVDIGVVGNIAPPVVGALMMREKPAEDPTGLAFLRECTFSVPD